MAHVIDRVDLLGYLASDARVLDPSTGTLVVRLSEAAAYYFRETLPKGVGQPLSPAFWNPATTSWSGAERPYRTALPPEPKSTLRAGCAGTSSKPRGIFFATQRSSARRPTSWSKSTKRSGKSGWTQLKWQYWTWLKGGYGGSARGKAFQRPADLIKCYLSARFNL